MATIILQTQEQDKLLREEVCKLKEQLGKSHCEWNAALVEKEEEWKTSWRKRESELETALEQERKEKETSRKRESELEAALVKKEEELQASKSRKSELQAAFEEKEREIHTLKTTLATNQHLHANAIVEHQEKPKMVEAQQEESPNAIAIHQESQEGNAKILEVFKRYFSRMIEAIYPDDITSSLYTFGLISKTEMIKIDNPQNDDLKKIKFLLDAVQRAIVIDSNNFKVFLTILKTVPKYEPLYETMSSAAKQLGMKG